MKIMLRNSAGEIFSMEANPENTFQILKTKLNVNSEMNLDANEINFKNRRISGNESQNHLDKIPEQNTFDYQTHDAIEDQLSAESSKVLKCLVPECGSTQKDYPNKCFFVLPSNEERLHHWLLVCRRSDLVRNLKNIASERYGICEDHFIGDNFLDSTKRILKSEAIPTIFQCQENVFKSEFVYEDEILGTHSIIKEELSDVSVGADSEERDDDDDDDDILSGNFNQLCRLCASHISDVVYIFNDTGQEQQIAKKINSCLPITVKITDPLPKQLCMSCVAKLNMCHEFAESCIEAENKLLRLNRKKYFVSHSSSMLKRVNFQSHNSSESLTSFSENEKKIKYVEHRHDDKNDLEGCRISQETVNLNKFDCPLCCGGNMAFNGIANHAMLDNNQERVTVSNPATLSDDHVFPSNDSPEACKIWEGNNLRSAEFEKSWEGNEDIREDDEVSTLHNDGQSQPLTLVGTISCRICDNVFENLELCISHAESHFEIDFYPCNLCDLCFTSLASFKSHCEKHHLENARSKNRISKRLMCNLCGKRFNSERTLSGHACGSSPRPFKCDECGKSFLTEVRLHFHQQIHQGGSSITCEHCGKMFSRENNLYDHVRLVHMREKAHCCDQCGKTFQLKARLIAHQRVHTGERPFECDICGGKFYDKATLKGHRLTHLDVKPFQCEKCGRCFARKTLFKQHTIAHLSEERKRPRTYSCRLCGGSVFSSYAKLIEHRKEVHPDAEMNEVDDSAQVSKPFKCEDCGKSFAYRVTLVAHRRNHTGELPFQCEFCSKRFSQKRSLILHRRIHTGEKPFMCMECGKRFVQSAHLYSHTRLHTGEKPYACEVCGEAFRLKDVRDAHQRKHTGERPFKCNVCGKAFRTSHSYYQHMWIHQGKKPYPCSYCGKAFRRSNGLKIHIRIHTGEKPHSCDICGRSFAQKQDMKKHRNLHGVGKL